MKFAKVFLATATLMVASIGPSFAGGSSPTPSNNPKVEIVDKVGYGGSGCPDRSASVTVSPDGQELTVLFDKYIAKGNGTSEEKRRNCDLAIPIKVPGGFQVSIYAGNYKGYVAPNTTGTLRTEYYYTGGGGTKYTDELKGEKEYDVQHDLVSIGKVWAPCGKDIIMRMRTSMVAKGDGIATVDSFELAHRGLVYHVEYQQWANK